MTFFDQWDPNTAPLIEEVCGPQGGTMLKTKTHLVIFYESIMVSL